MSIVGNVFGRARVKMASISPNATRTPSRAKKTPAQLRRLRPRGAVATGPGAPPPSSTAAYVFRFDTAGPHPRSRQRRIAHLQPNGRQNSTVLYEKASTGRLRSLLERGRERLDEPGAVTITNGSSARSRRGREDGQRRNRLIAATLLAATSSSATPDRPPGRPTVGRRARAPRRVLPAAPSRPSQPPRHPRADGDRRARESPSPCVAPTRRGCRVRDPGRVRQTCRRRPETPGSPFPFARTGRSALARPPRVSPRMPGSRSRRTRRSSAVPRPVPGRGAPGGCRAGPCERVRPSSRGARRPPRLLRRSSRRSRPVVRPSPRGRLPQPAAVTARAARRAAAVRRARARRANARVCWATGSTTASG